MYVCACSRDEKAGHYRPLEYVFFLPFALVPSRLLLRLYPGKFLFCVLRRRCSSHLRIFFGNYVFFRRYSYPVTSPFSFLT